MECHLFADEQVRMICGTVLGLAFFALAYAMRKVLFPHP
jgi:hypothetical protein